MRDELKDDSATVSTRVTIAAGVLATLARAIGPQLAAVEALRYADELMETSGWNQMRVDSIAEQKQQQERLEASLAAACRSAAPGSPS